MTSAGYQAGYPTSNRIANYCPSKRLALRTAACERALLAQPQSAEVWVDNAGTELFYRGAFVTSAGILQWDTGQWKLMHDEDFKCAMDEKWYRRIRPVELVANWVHYKLGNYGSDGYAVKLKWMASITFDIDLQPAPKRDAQQAQEVKKAGGRRPTGVAMQKGPGHPTRLYPRCAGPDCWCYDCAMDTAWWNDENKSDEDMREKVELEAELIAHENRRIEQGWHAD